MATNVVLSPNVVKTSERLDANGNVIDPRTKQIIRPREVESVAQPNPIPPEAVIAPTTQAKTEAGSLSILQQIEEAKVNLQALEELKKLKIAEKKAELELLQQ